MHRRREAQRQKLAARGTRAEMQGWPRIEEYALGLGRARRPKLPPSNSALAGAGPGPRPEVGSSPSCHPGVGTGPGFLQWDG